MRGFWQRMVLALVVLCLVSLAAVAAPKAYTVRFSDMPEADVSVTDVRAEAPALFRRTAGCEKMAGSRCGPS